MGVVCDIVCIFVCVVCVVLAGMCYSVWMEIGGQAQDLVLSFHHVAARDQHQVIRLGGKCLYSLRHLTGSKYIHFLIGK